MKRMLLVCCLCFLLTACTAEYDINGTYELESGDKDFKVVICDDFCMLEVTSVTEGGGVANVILDGRVSTEDEFVIITIDKDKQIAGNKFQFVCEEDTLINTSDNSVLKKVEADSSLPVGKYMAVSGKKTLELNIEENECRLTVHSVNEVGQTAEVSDTGALTAEGNIISVEFESKTLGDDIYRFIYNSDSDILMDTEDGTIYEKVEEEE